MTTWRGSIPRLIAIVQKNLLRLKHTRTALLVILLGPIVLMLLVGLAFNTSSFSGIKVGTYSQTYPEYAQNVIGNIEKSSSFAVMKQQSEEACTEGVKQGRLHLCIIFPEQAQGGRRTVIMNVDSSRLNLVSTLLEVMNTKFTKEGSNIAREMTEQLLSQLEETRASLAQRGGAIATLQQSVGSMDSGLGTVAAGISNVSFPVPNASFGDAAGSAALTRAQLSDTQESVESQLRIYNARLKETDESLSQAQGAIKIEQQNRERVKGNITLAYAELGCQERDPENLAPLLSDSADLRELVRSLDSPECSFLYTLQIHLDEQILTLDKTESDIGAMQRNVRETRSQLDEFGAEADDLFAMSEAQLEMSEGAFDQADAMLAEARNRSAQLEARKLALSQELVRMRSSLQSASSLLGELNASLAATVAGLEQASTITPDDIVSPFDLKVKAVTNKKTVLTFLYPSLFILVIMFVAIMLAVTIVNKERASRAYFRNFITPTPGVLFIAGIFLTTVLLTLVQVVVLLLLGTFAFSVDLAGSIGGILFVVLLAITVFTLVGIIIACAFSNEETTTLAGIVISVILFLFSSAFIPLERMAAISRYIVHVNPFYLLEFLFSKQLIFQASPFSFWGELALLLFEILLLGAAAVASWRIVRSRV